ncbi:uncharacterized protein LOC131534545 [Onychostoma macrolepis]|uniref:uncharacterized protein LOC131534545 n=1 Tax=Onychostoma macrolepis TaxID=369639 RepID=UPI00272DB75D|nr:uncharacterized protein LOC131534545 [Onychostoma macrolepis]
MSVSDLSDELSRLYSELSETDQSGDYIGSKLARHGSPEWSLWRRRRFSLRTFYIFDDACLIDEDKLNKVIEEFKKLINLPVYQAVQTSSGIQDTYLSVNRDVSSKSTSANNNNVRMSEMTVKLSFDNMSTYYNVAEDVKVVAGRACLVTNAKPVEREVSVGSDAVECQLVPEKQKTAADGSLCSSITESDYICRCNTGDKTKPCCSSPCLYQDDLNGYRCYSDQKLIECSPRYSLIMYKGQKCLDDYPCATYGYDYYWCWTADNWDYCSPPLRNSKTKNGKCCRSNHACAKYGSRNTWCYTDDKDSWDYC